jgi:hypothetical protein
MIGSKNLRSAFGGVCGLQNEFVLFQNGRDWKPTAHQRTRKCQRLKLPGRRCRFGELFRWTYLLPLSYFRFAGNTWALIRGDRSLVSTTKASTFTLSCLRRWICYPPRKKNENIGIKEVRGRCCLSSSSPILNLCYYLAVAAYEREMQIKLTEMAETVLLIRQKDALDAKKAADISAEDGSETVCKQDPHYREIKIDCLTMSGALCFAQIKPVYVMGNKISMEYLAMQDMDVAERLNGIV